MKVREAVAGDAEAVLRLIRELPELPQWRHEDLAVPDPEVQGDSPKGEGLLRRLTIAEQDDELVGFAQVSVLLDEAELESIAVDTNWRGRGVGRLLLAEVVRLAQELGAATVWLEVRKGNEAALGLYRSAGFDVIGTRRGYYRAPVEDALLLQLSCG